MKTLGLFIATYGTSFIMAWYFAKVSIFHINAMFPYLLFSLYVFIIGAYLAIHEPPEGGRKIER